ncbi:predicted protein [Postia placenta Mad-698-R]|nr:predicted protein [Postia placenta Mad-698-R]
MDDVPVEIWSRIFTLACTDNGTTGRSLAQVSRYFRDASSAVRLRSIALIGLEQTRRFADLLERTPPELRRVRCLCISHCDPPAPFQQPLYSSEEINLMPVEKLAEMFVLRQYNLANKDHIVWKLRTAEGRPALVSQLATARKGAFAVAISHILQLIGASLETLTLHMGAYYPQALHDVFLPRLSELSVVGSFLLSSTLLHSKTRKVQVLPSLTHLHLVDCPDFLAVFGGQVPRLTHLRMTGVTHLMSRACIPLSAALSAPRTLHSDEPLQDSAFPDIEQVIIQPPIHIKRPGGSRWATGLRELIESEKVVVLKADSGQPSYGFPEAQRDWLERNMGEDGCWTVNRSNVDAQLGPRKLDHLGAIMAYMA